MLHSNSHEPLATKLEPDQSDAQPASEPGTSEQLASGRRFSRYLTWLGVSTAFIVSVWGSLNGILLPNHVQTLEFANFFVGNDASANLQELANLKAAVDAGSTTATAEQTRMLGILHDYEVARANSLALLITVGLTVTMFMGPFLGLISDRTRSRFGRRTPFIFFGGIIGAASIAAMQFAPNLLLLIVLWSVAGLFVGMAQAAQNATIADRVVYGKRGTASAISGLGAFMGGILGTVMGAAAFGALGLGSYYIPALLVALGACLFVAFAPDRSSRDLSPTSAGLGQALKGFLVPLRSHDFRWVWIARLIMTFGWGVSTAFGLFMLQSYVQPALNQAEATAMAPILALVGLPGTVISLVIAGRWSDKVGRRKPFVIFSSLLLAASFVVPLVSPTVPGLLIQGIVAGVAYGAYLSVDQALFIDVLPNMKDAGRDLGIAGLGMSMGNALAPIIAAQVFSLTGNYVWIWVVALVLVVAAAFAIFPVRSVK
ncbi:MFS transporter [Paenarthrobacter nicotinovorans]|uniref:MFS transporter n=1 Tax=Paenarthrobacter nicotinovorans TaxID=29320 RepID=UPI003749F05D